MTDKARALYPYEFPEDLVERYASPEDAALWAEYDELSRKYRRGEMPEKYPPKELTERAQRIKAAAEHRFFDDTLCGDYRLFCELLAEMVYNYALEDALRDCGIRINAIKENSPGMTKEQFDELHESFKTMDEQKFTIMLFFRLEALVGASVYYGWNKVKTDGKQDAIAELVEKALRDMYFPESDEPPADQSDEPPDGTQSKGRPPEKKEKRKQVHIDALPEQLIYPLDVVNHYAAHGSFQAGGFESVEMFPKQYRLPNGNYTKGKPVEVFAMLEYDGTDIAQRLDLIDSAILRGIYSLLDAGETRFSVSHIWELIAGEGQKTNRSRIESLVLRIRRMIGTTAKISFQQFAEAKGLEYTDDITAQILPGVALRERRNARGELVGADVKCTQPLESFPLYQFAEITGQIARAPLAAVTVRGMTVNDKPQQLTDNRLTVREMIYQRILRRHRNKSDQVILFSTLYDKLGAESKVERQRIRDAAESFLCEWAELGTIYNFAFRKKGKNFDAIVISNTAEEMQNHTGVQWLVNR